MSSTAPALRARVPRLAGAALRACPAHRGPQAEAERGPAPCRSWWSSRCSPSVASWGCCCSTPRCSRRRSPPPTCSARPTCSQARQQSLQMQLDQLRDPQSIALKAQRMGMVLPTQPRRARPAHGQGARRPGARPPGSTPSACSRRRRPSRPLLDPPAHVTVVDPSTAAHQSQHKPRGNTARGSHDHGGRAGRNNHTGHTNAPATRTPPATPTDQEARRCPSTRPRRPNRSGRTPAGRNRAPWRCRRAGAAAAPAAGRSSCACARASCSSPWCSRSSGPGWCSCRASSRRSTRPWQPRPGGTVTVELPAQRGDILDRNGRPLADSVDGRMVVADPVQTQAKAPQLARFLAKRLHIDYFSTLQALTRKNSRFAYVARRVPASRAVRVVNAATDAGYKGLATRNDPLRSYPGHDVAANLVGFMGTDGPLAGLELTFNKDAGRHRRVGDLRGRRRQPHPARPQHGDAGPQRQRPAHDHRRGPPVVHPARAAPDRARLRRRVRVRGGARHQDRRDRSPWPTTRRTTRATRRPPRSRTGTRWR